jgi:hypothetical protein
MNSFLLERLEKGEGSPGCNRDTLRSLASDAANAIGLAK